MSYSQIEWDQLKGSRQIYHKRIIIKKRIQLLYLDETFYLVNCDYKHRYIPKAAGLKWNGEYQHWFTKDVNKAIKLEMYASKELKNMIIDMLKAPGK